MVKLKKKKNQLKHDLQEASGSKAEYDQRMGYSWMIAKLFTLWEDVINRWCDLEDNKYDMLIQIVCLFSEAYVINNLMKVVNIYGLNVNGPFVVKHEVSRCSLQIIVIYHRHGEILTNVLLVKNTLLTSPTACSLLRLFKMKHNASMTLVEICTSGRRV